MIGFTLEVKNSFDIFYPCVNSIWPPCLFFFIPVVAMGDISDFGLFVKRQCYLKRKIIELPHYLSLHGTIFHSFNRKRYHISIHYFLLKIISCKKLPWVDRRYNRLKEYRLGFVVEVSLFFFLEEPIQIEFDFYICFLVVVLMIGGCLGRVC